MAEPRTPRQTLQNLKGEIEFRAKLARQHVDGEVVLPDYYRKEDHDRILLERVAATSEKMSDLERLGVQFSPFLELGAERGQRSLVLANDFQADGVAADISYHQLATIDHFSHMFGREKLPNRICCNANYLPFKSEAFSFVFCYEFLHHFPSLEPVINEVERVLGDGYFYFDEEPFKRVFRLRLYTRKNKIYSQTSLRKNKWWAFIESFISKPSSDEVEHGIIENEDLDLAEWIRALEVFDDRDIDLVSVGNVTSKLGPRLRLKNVPNFLLGGRISGLCRKRTETQQPSQRDVSELLACPGCRLQSPSHRSETPPLVKSPGGLTCSRCGVEYPEKDGILFLLPSAELKELYPSLARSGASG